MKRLWFATIVTGVLAGAAHIRMSAQEPPWDPARVQPCDRTCLVAIMDRYLDALVKQAENNFLGGSASVVGLSVIEGS